MKKNLYKYCYNKSDVKYAINYFKNINQKFATATVKVSKTAPYFDENNTEISDAVVYIKTKNENIYLNYNTEKKYYELEKQTEKT